MKKHGKSLPDERVMAVRMFYEDDEFSRMCPGKKDFVSKRVDVCTRQKQLLLTNLREMHIIIII